MNYKKLIYGLSGLTRRVKQKHYCPSCGSSKYLTVDRKGFHELLRCDECQLLYRWPYETQAEMSRFYQRKYQQVGMTTDLPDMATLNEFLANGFQGTEKDFSRIVKLLKVLSVPSAAKILDFGANWGYGTWQFKKAGYNAIGYELSEPRASYSKNLDVEVYTEWSEIEDNGPFDVVFSSHVLEHTPDPAQALRKKINVLSPNGLLIALFPNGSEAFQKADPVAFHHLWGQVHPVMLDEKFIRKVLPGSALAMGSYCPEDLDRLKNWDRSTLLACTLNTSEMLIVWAQNG